MLLLYSRFKGITYNCRFAVQRRDNQHTPTFTRLPNNVAFVASASAFFALCVRNGNIFHSALEIMWHFLISLIHPVSCLGKQERANAHTEMPKLVFMKAIIIKRDLLVMCINMYMRAVFAANERKCGKISESEIVYFKTEAPFHENATKCMCMQ